MFYAAFTSAHKHHIIYSAAVFSEVAYQVADQCQVWEQTKHTLITLWGVGLES